MPEDFQVHVVTRDASFPGGQGEAAFVPGQSDNQESLGGFARAIFGERAVSAKDLEKSWENTFRLLNAIIDDSAQSQEKGFALDEMEVALTVTGEGNIAFVSASAEASITLKFKRS